MCEETIHIYILYYITRQYYRIEKTKTETKTKTKKKTRMSLTAGTLAVNAVQNCSCSPNIKVNDVVVYEYVDKHKIWKVGLATILSFPTPFLVQLRLWRPDVLFTCDSLQESPDKRVKRRIDINKNIGTLQESDEKKKYEFMASRRGVEIEAKAAAMKLIEVCEKIKNIKLCEWREMRSYCNPPTNVILVMKAVLTIIGERCYSWAVIQNLIRSPDFVAKVIFFDPIKLSKTVRETLKEDYLTNSKFIYENTTSGGCNLLYYLQQWVVAQVAASEAAEKLIEHDRTYKEKLVIINDIKERSELQEQGFQVCISEEKTLPLDSNNNNDNNNNSNNSDGDDENSIFHLRRVIPQPIKKDENNFCGLGVMKDFCGVNRTWSITKDFLITLRSTIIYRFNGNRNDSNITIGINELRDIEVVLKHRSFEGNFIRETEFTLQNLNNTQRDICVRKYNENNDLHERNRQNFTNTEKGITVSERKQIEIDKDNYMCSTSLTNYSEQKEEDFKNSLAVIGNYKETITYIKHLEEELQQQCCKTEMITVQLNNEVCAHEKTRQKLVTKEKELKGLLNRNCNTVLVDVVGRLEEESKRQRREAQSNMSTLNEVYRILGKVPTD